MFFSCEVKQAEVNEAFRAPGSITESSALVISNMTPKLSPTSHACGSLEPPVNFWGEQQFVWSSLGNKTSCYLTDVHYNRTEVLFVRLIFVFSHMTFSLVSRWICCPQNRKDRCIDCTFNLPQEKKVVLLSADWRDWAVSFSRTSENRLMFVTFVSSEFLFCLSVKDLRLQFHLTRKSRCKNEKQ